MRVMTTFMRSSTPLWTLSLCLLLPLAACGDDGGSHPSSPDAAMSGQALTCKSIALCTTHYVKTFLGVVPAPQGGTIQPGRYRLIYDQVPGNVGETAGYRDDLDVLEFRGAGFAWAGFFNDRIGTFTTAGTTLTLQATRRCNLGADGDPSTSKIDYPYTATSTEVRLFDHVTSSNGTSWDKMYVYQLISDPAAVCTTVPTEPASPGPSERCTVTNCACNFAIEGTVNACT